MESSYQCAKTRKIDLTEKNIVIKSHIVSPDQINLKKIVGYKAVDDYVKSGMIVGLGTGSTAFFAVERVGHKLQCGELTNIICIPTSENTKQQALSLNIPLTTLNEVTKLDVVIDGADDVDVDLSLIKGGGGALLREKLVEAFADKFICIVDESKLSKKLGPKFPLPVEITPFCYQHTIRMIERLDLMQGCRTVLRMGNVSNNKVDGTDIAVTDNGNYIVDIYFTHPIEDATLLGQQLKAMTGVVDHGIFVNMVTALIVAQNDGTVRVSSKEQGSLPWW